MEGNILQIDLANYTFFDFSSFVIAEATNKDVMQGWFQKLIAVNKKIAQYNLQDKKTFTDDKLVGVAFEIMCKTEMFNRVAEEREWAILKRYIELYVVAKEGKWDALHNVITMYMGYTFTDAEMDAETEAKFKEQLAIVKAAFKNGTLEKMPPFFLELIDELKKEEPKKATKEKAPSKENVFADEAAQWQGVIDLATIILEDVDDLTTDEVLEWTKIMAQASKALGNN